jgi:ankyrin repeat protein
LATVRLLLDRGADVTAEGGRNGTALELAKQRNHQAVISLLLERGADSNASDSESDDDNNDG